MVDIDIGQLSEAINDKADRDINNLTDSGYAKGSGLGMPSTRYIDLTLGASATTYTAPANGYILYIATSSGGGEQIILRDESIDHNTKLGQSIARGSSDGLVIFVPLKRGTIFSVEYSTPTPIMLRFIYADGEPTQE